MKLKSRIESQLWSTDESHGKSLAQAAFETLASLNHPAALLPYSVSRGNMLDLLPWARSS